MLRKIPIVTNNVLHSKKSTISIISRFNSINTHASNLISLEKKAISEELKKDSIGSHLSTAWTIFQKNLISLREIGINEDYVVAEKIGRLHCVKILENFDNDLGFGADLIVKLIGFLNARNKDFPLEYVSIGRDDLGKARECISYWEYALNELIKKDKISNKNIVLNPDIPFSERKKIEISINNINSMIYMYYHPEYVNKSLDEIATKAKCTR